MSILRQLFPSLLPGAAFRQAAPASDAAPGPASHTDETHGSLPRLLALLVSVLVLLWIAIAVIVQQDVKNTRNHAELNLRNLSRAFAEHTAKTIEGADQAARFVRSEYLEHRQAFDISKYLSSQAIIDSYYQQLGIIGADGYATHSSQPFTRVDLHDREHFRVHAQGRADTLFVSKPVLGKISGKWSIQIARRISEPDGRFGGVVVVSLPLNYFTRFYDDVDLGPHGTIALTGMDGYMRARASGGEQQQGQDLRGSPLFKHMREQGSGVVRMRSSIDGLDRLFAFRSLPAYQLIVVAGVTIDDAFAEYRYRRNASITFGVIVSVILVLFAANLHSRSRRQAQLMTELRGSRAKAEEANSLKSKFLASVSHELRTPLNGILGYAELIRDTSEDPQAVEFGGIIHDSARHLHSLVNTILDLAKIESGHMVTTFAATELRPLLDETHRHHAVHAQSRGLSFTLAVDPACPAQISTDRTRLLQVLGNVVNNAIKFTDQGHVRLDASTHQGRLLLRVSDSGIGIAPARLGQLFTRFQGVAAELVHCNQGAGLGLSLAKELMELLGGTISVTSELGIGSEVCISLPLDISQQQGASHENA